MSDSMVEWAGGQMAGGAAGAVGASLFNYGLSQMGFSLPGDNTAALSAIQQTLNQIVTMLKDFEKKIDSLETELVVKIETDNYESRVSGIQGQFNLISDLTKDYNDLVAKHGANAEISADLLQTIHDNLVHKQGYIHDEVAGPMYTQSLYELFASVRRDAKRFLSHYDSDALKARINYCQNAQYLQTVLLIAYHNAQNKQQTAQNRQEDGSHILVSDADTRTAIDEVIQTFQDNMVAENRFQVLHIPPGAVYDKNSFMLLWFGNCDYVDWTTARDRAWATEHTTAREMGVETGWGLPSLAELLSSDKVEQVSI